MSFLDIGKLVVVASVLSVLCYVFARGTHAQICMTLTMPFKMMNDFKIYESSVGKMLSPALIAISCPLVISGSIALTSRDDPHYLKLAIFMMCTILYIVGVSILSYITFKKTVLAMGFEWPPKTDRM